MQLVLYLESELIRFFKACFLPKGDDPKPEDDAEDEDTRSVLLPLLHNEDEVAKPDSLCSWPELLLSVPLAKTIPVRL